MEKAILHKWLKAGYIDKRIFHQTEEGTPQGGPISPVLANLTLDGLEAQLRTLHPSYHQHRRAKINLVRFADDFIITGSSKELLENEVKPLVEAFMKERGLQLSTEKTLITHMADGFDFLGQNVRTYDGKLIIKPSKKKRENILGKSPQGSQGEPRRNSWTSDLAAQSAHWRLGTLSPTRCEQGNLPRCR